MLSVEAAMPSIEAITTVPGALAILVWALLAATKKNLLAPMWARIPDKWQWLVPIALAGAAGALPALTSGNLKAAGIAFISAAGAGLGATGIHQSLKASPLPYGNTTDNEKSS